MKNLKNKWVTKNVQERLYHLSVPVVGLTGGIATGKSTVAELFGQRGCPVIDADRLVKNIYQTSEALNFIQRHFPNAISEGKIDFKKLRSLVFGDSLKQQLVEQFIYSKLPAEFLSAFEKFVSPTLVIYDVPLLFEKRLHPFVDASICVYSPRTLQLERLTKRDGIATDLAESMLSKQMDIEEKRRLANLVIENTQDLATLTKNFNQMFEELMD